MHRSQHKRIFLQISAGFLILTCGFILICLLSWDSFVSSPISIGIGLAGATLCTVGVRLFLVATETAATPSEISGAELGRFRLNGRDLMAYESEAPNGRKRFRLAAVPALTSEQEAALVRYLALEGFFLSLWPEMRERIEEEAGWAFLV